jgi:hypothetical protein
MLLIIAWVLAGAVVGGIGVTGIASTVIAGSGGDIGTAVAFLLIGVTLGAAGGGTIGWLIRQKFAGNPSKLNLFAGAPVIVAFALVVGMSVFEQLRERMRNRDSLLPDGHSVWLTYQVRLPPGTPAPDEKALMQEFRTEKETRKQSFPGHDVHVERVGDRVVIQGSFESRKTAERRVVRLRIGDGPTHEFVLKLLPPRPPAGYAKSYSEWHGAEQVEEADKPPRPPLPSERLEIRYKMDII